MEWGNEGPHRPPKGSPRSPGLLRSHLENHCSIDPPFTFTFLSSLTPSHSLSWVFLFPLHTCFYFFLLTLFTVLHLTISLNTPFLSHLYLPSPLFLPPPKTSLPYSPQVIYENEAFLNKRNYLGGSWKDI